MKTFFYILISLLILSVTFLYGEDGGYFKTPSVAETQTDVETSTDAETDTDAVYAYAYAGFTPAYADVDAEPWYLMLVNRDYILPEDYEVKLLPSIAADPDSLRLDYRVAEHYNAMYIAALEDGVTLSPVSGYRSVERQTANFEKKIAEYTALGYSKTQATQLAARIVLLPGTSEHNAGLAMDINSLDQEFELTVAFDWLAANAADYGFIMRYPKDKQEITKVIYEPWHWRYVGVDAAKEMNESGQCLEEYLGLA